MNLLAKAARGLALTVSLMASYSQVALAETDAVEDGIFGQTLSVSHRVYEGQIAGQPVVIELVIEGWDVMSGRYFFPSERISRPILISNDGTKELSDDAEPVKLKLGRYADEANAGAEPILLLRSNSESGTLSGELRADKGAVQKVVLSPLEWDKNTAGQPSAFMKTLHESLYAYDWFFYRDAEPTRVNQTQTGGITVTWWQDPVSQFSLFQVESGYTPEQRERVNRYLRTVYWDTLSQMSLCRRQDGLKTQINLLSANAMSYTLTGKYQCQGDEQAQIKLFTHTLSLREHEGEKAQAAFDELRLSDVLWIDSLPVPVINDAHESGDDDGEEQLENSLPGWLKEQFSALYPAKMTKGAPGACDYTETETWSHKRWFPLGSAGRWAVMRWSLTPQGILFKPIKPDGSGVCDNEDWSVLPWRVVNRYPGRIQYLSLP
ncbi:hypothetical protein [Dickeya lacustris]|uniref:DUF4424 domain-containing protein n=1 Tax=Dickeya lacustris TaxID=2259638 RepID=A0ABY8G9L4_9GAMM|nr:hypothetical protein [Dickeya lacustris]WFN56643.1 hypothetical protein O1Q98_05030 [Dickeya lacustris]